MLCAYYDMKKEKNDFASKNRNEYRIRCIVGHVATTNKKIRILGCIFICPPPSDPLTDDNDDDVQRRSHGGKTIAERRARLLTTETCVMAGSVFAKQGEVHRQTRFTRIRL